MRKLIRVRNAMAAGTLMLALQVPGGCNISADSLDSLLGLLENVDGIMLRVGTGGFDGRGPRHDEFGGFDEFDDFDDHDDFDDFDA